MKPKLLALIDKILLRKRALIETVNDQLKNVCQIEHSRHRSWLNALIHLLAGLTPTLGRKSVRRALGLHKSGKSSTRSTPSGSCCWHSLIQNSR